MSAAAAAECAADAGRFAEVHHALFAADLRDTMPVAALVAAAPGLDGAALATCAADETIRRRVKSDFDRAMRLGLRGTPGVQIRDRLWTGGAPSSVIESRLREAIVARQ